MPMRRRKYVIDGTITAKSKQNGLVLFSAAFFATMLMGLPNPSSVRAEGGRNLVVIVDSSGSMWGQIDGVSKAAMTRAALGDFVKQLPPSTQFGVMAYGHIEKQSCSVAQMIVPISKPNPGKALKALSRIRPKGRTPIATAMERAAKALNYKKKEATIVLLSDGYENCRRDPCVAAKTLHNLGKKLRIHVIGINLEDKDRTRLQCVSNSANGLFANARDKLELAASLNAVLITLEGGSAWARTAPPTYKPKPKRLREPGLHLSAVLRKDGVALKSGVIWRIFADKTGANGNRKEIRRETAPTPNIKLPPGRYIVEVNYGLVRTAREVTVISGQPTEAEFVLGAGTIRLAAVMNDEGAPLNRVLYQLFDIGSGKTPERKAISRSSDGTVVFHVPSGSYKVTAEHGYTRLEQLIAVEPGSISELTLVMNIGTLELAAAAVPGGDPLKRMVYRIHKISDRTGAVGQEVVRTAAHHPQIRLPSGDYLIHAQHDLAEVSERATVQPGRLTRKIINMNTGALRISSKFSGATQKFKNHVSYKIYQGSPETGGGRREIARTTRTGKTFRLTAGDYVVAGRLGNLNATIETKVTVLAGRLTEVELEHNAALVSFAFVKKQGGQPEQNVFWMLLDDSGQELWRTSRPTPRFALAKGNYRAVAEISGKRLNKRFTVNAGEEKRVVLGRK